jgi:enoyl-CoA hydratase/carnithine racemase
MIEQSNRDGCVTLTINRPHRKNAFDEQTVAMLLSALGEVERNRAVRCLVIEGAGDTFSAGRDLKEAKDAELSRALEQHDQWSEIFTVLQRLKVPSVAVVCGFAVAGGFTLAMGCDFVLTHRGAKFGALEMQNGFPAAVCTPILANKAPPRLGLEFAMFGELIEAERLLSAGLVNRLAEDIEALEQLRDEFITRILELDPLAVRQTLETFRAAQQMPLSDSMTLGRHLNQLLDASGAFARGSERFALGREDR